MEVELDAPSLHAFLLFYSPDVAAGLFRVVVHGKRRGSGAQAFSPH